jgi:hypothetical protein
MITAITNGMASANMITALNNNFTEICGVGNFTTITNAHKGTVLETNLNAGFQVSYSFVGQRGSYLLSIFNNEFIADYIPTPSGLTLTWTDDYLKIDFTDNSGGTAQHEIWESKSGAGYTLLHTLAAGVVTYNYYAWQNASLSFKIRAKDGSDYSKYCAVASIVTPLIIETDQSTLHTVTFTHMDIFAGKTVNINWGDAVNADLTGNNNITHDYGVGNEGTYFIKLSGDTEYIVNIEAYEQNWLVGDLTKWIWPIKMQLFHCYQNAWQGDVSDWDLSRTDMRTFHIGGNDNVIDGDCSNWFASTNNIMPSMFNDFHMYPNTGIGGETANWVMGANQNHMYIGDICHGFARGSFANMAAYLYGALANYSTIAELDGILVYINTFWETHVPIRDCFYNFQGMGIPTATGLTAKSGIEAKYTAAGFTATITVDS